MIEIKSSKKVLIVEDDRELAEWIEQYLIKHQWECKHVDNGLEVVAMVSEFNPCVIILDGMLPGLDGFEVCKQIRKTSKIPIIMLTARDEEVDEVLGLEAGANEYLIKPVRARALLARINKMTELGGKSNLSFSPYAFDTIVLGGLVINHAARSVSLGGGVLKISSKEFDVLYYLAVRAGELVKREELVKALRGLDFDGFDRTIDLNISRLRKKLHDDASDPFRIKTVWGKGYILIKDSWS